MEISSITIYAFIAITSLLVYLYKRQTSYWKIRGIPHDEPEFFHGNARGLRTTKNFAAMFTEAYQKFKGTGPFAGFYLSLKPIALILDLDLIKSILIKDFNSFDDRGIFHNEEDDPLTANLFSLDGPKWRRLRAKLSPTFTSGKMKFMFPTLISVAKEFINVMDEIIAKDDVVEMKDILERFTTDIIGTVAFGIECNSLRNPNTEFRTIGTKVFTEQRHNNIISALIESFPTLALKLRCRMLTDDVHNFYCNLVKETIKYREENNIQRNDFMNLLIDLKNNKLVKSESGEDFEALNIKEVIAQAFIFFSAGFETSSTTMGFCLYELAQHPDIQEKARKEVLKVFEKYNEEFTYDSMKNLVYLEQVIFETLRKYPILAHLNRRANQDYVTSDPKYKIEKDIMVIIPVGAIQNDPEYYPNPEVFDPDRFTPEEIAKRHPITWLPFGDGPRNCIGLRFGKMQVRCGLAFLLRNYKFSTTKKTQIPLQFETKSFLLAPSSGIYLKVEKI